MRIAIAKSFVENYTIDDIRKLEKAFMKQVEAERIERNRKIEDLKGIVPELNAMLPEYILKKVQFELRGYQPPIIEFYHVFRDPNKKYDNGLRRHIKIISNSQGNYSILRDGLYSDKVDCGSLAELKEELKEFVEKLESDFRIHQKHLREHDIQQQQEKYVYQFIEDTVLSKDTITIIKKGSIYLAIDGHFTFSASKNAKGKYHHLDGRKLARMILAGGYTEFCEINRNEYKHGTAETLEYSDIF